MIKASCRNCSKEFEWTLAFFKNPNTLTDAFIYETAHTNKMASCLGMFHSNTDAVIKREVLFDLTEEDGKYRVVFCSIS